MAAAVNEVNLPFAEAKRAFPARDFAGWHTHHAHILRASDQGSHLITTSFSGSNWYNLSMLPSVDFVGRKMMLSSFDGACCLANQTAITISVHGYSGSRRPGADNQADGSVLTRQIGTMHRRMSRHGRDKPVFFSENGLIPGTEEYKEDPEGRGFHNSLWAPVAGAGAATNFVKWRCFLDLSHCPSR